MQAGGANVPSGDRSLRYCFLDSGHHLGAIEAAAYAGNYDYHVQFDLDYVALNDDLGFEHKEWAMAAVIIGEAKAKTVRRLRSPLPVVPGTDYFEPNRFIEAGYQQTLDPPTRSATPPNSVTLHSSVPLALPFTPTQWQQAIHQRRSARRFYPQPISADAWLTVCATLQPPIPSEHHETLAIYAVVHWVTGLSPGLYRLQDDGSTCLRTGEFQAQTGYLCINQAIARDSAVVFFIVADYHNYRVALQQAGMIGQRIYLAATALDLGCSGIGAFYDDETQVFLETDHPVLYAIAVGQVQHPDPRP